ncbi:MAG: hypothetical protein AAF236_00785 [Verrucomicrobiota bacterium]
MATQGVTNLFGLTAPGIGFVSESSRSRSIELAKLPDQTGVTRCVAAKPKLMLDVSIKGMGVQDLLGVTAGKLDAVDTIYLISRKRTETTSEYPEFEDTGKGYATLAAPAASAAGDPPVPASHGAVCPVLGITSVGIAAVTSFEIERKVEETEERLATDGTFLEQDFYDEHYEFTVKGSGDLPVVLALGGDGDLASSVPELGSGVTILLTDKLDEKAGSYPEWEVTGENWPNAA